PRPRPGDDAGRHDRDLAPGVDGGGRPLRGALQGVRSRADGAEHGRCRALSAARGALRRGARALRRRRAARAARRARAGRAGRLGYGALALGMLVYALAIWQIGALTRADLRGIGQALTARAPS